VPRLALIAPVVFASLLSWGLDLGCTRPNPAYLGSPEDGSTGNGDGSAKPDVAADVSIDTKPDVTTDRGPDTAATDTKVDIKPDLKTDTGTGSDAGDAGDAGPVCVVAADCTTRKGPAPCGSWECRAGACVLNCPNCTDLDGDGYGVGSGCAGPDCDDTDPMTLSSHDSRNCPVGAVAGQGPICRAGTQSCTAGVWSACIGQVVPSGEACNGQDDDCNGTADDNLPETTFTCGQGNCQVSVPSCNLGLLGECVPNSSMAMPDDRSCNNMDDDCDGIVDQNCQAIIDSCVHVSPSGHDDTGNGTTMFPYATIPMGIAVASMRTPGPPPPVCVAGGPTCQDRTTYTVGDSSPFLMSNGVSVYGNYEAMTWTRCPIDPAAPAPTVTIELREIGGVRFMNTINLPTALDGFVLTRNISGGTQASIAAVTVNGAKQVRLANLVVNDAASATATYGVNLVTGGEATITHCLLFGGAGTVESYGVRSFNSKPTILENCTDIDATRDATRGRCTTDCSTTPTLGIVGQAASTTSVTGVGVLLNASPGASVETSTICGMQGTQAIGVHIAGDATGTVIHASSITASGGGSSSLGILAEDCNNATPWIVGNALIQGQQGTTRAAGIVARGACNPVIDGNTLISGGGDTTTGQSVGISCESNAATQASLCAVLGNETIQGSGIARTAQAIGVACLDRSCARIAGNIVKGSSAVTTAFGVLLHNDGTMVEQNRITGGCGGQLAVGLQADDSFARVQNNLINAGICPNTVITASPTNIGLHVLGANDQNEMDINSNTIDGGGNAAGMCTSTALELDAGTPAPAAPKGIVRNNILTGGICLLAATTGVPIRTDFSEALPTTDPRIFQNNDLDSSVGTTLYVDEGTTRETTVTAVNSLTDTTISGNISAPPMFAAPSTDFSTADLSLNANSACKGAGTKTGAPIRDFDGTLRSATNPSIGAYE